MNITLGVGEKCKLVKNMYVWGTFSPISRSLVSVCLGFCVGIDLSARADNSSLKSYVSADPFKIMFKCMSGYTTERGKFIMPVQEKLSYDNSFGRCESFGFKNDSYESSQKL